MGKRTIKEQILSDLETEGETHIRHFYRAVEADELPDPETMQFIAQAFREIYAGHDPKKALAISGKKGRKADIDTEIRHALMVENLISDGDGQDDARKKVAKGQGKEFKTIRRHHIKHKNIVRAVIRMHGGNKVDLDEVKITTLDKSLREEERHAEKK